MNLLLRPLEALKLATAPARLRWPPLFVVGAPRTGTTLVGLHLSNSLRFADFSSAAKFNPRTPYLSTRAALAHRAALGVLRQRPWPGRGPARDQRRLADPRALLPVPAHRGRARRRAPPQFRQRTQWSDELEQLAPGRWLPVDFDEFCAAPGDLLAWIEVLPGERPSSSKASRLPEPGRAELAALITPIVERLQAGLLGSR